MSSGTEKAWFSVVCPLFVPTSPSSPDSHANLRRNRGWWPKLWESGTAPSELQWPEAPACHLPCGWCLSLRIKCIFSQKSTVLGAIPLVTYWLPRHLQESLWTHRSVEFGWDWLKLSKIVKVGRGMNWCRHKQCTSKNRICLENYSHLDVSLTHRCMGIQIALVKTFNKTC